jgi:hypothetical protein
VGVNVGALRFPLVLGAGGGAIYNLNDVTSSASATNCYDQIMKLAYLNQQSDGGSLTLRRGKKCLTEDELNAINNQDVQRNHPLNCANINAKPYPYYDAGLMKVMLIP